MVHAHDWNSEYWLERFVRNHNKIIDCQIMLNDNDIDKFRANCSLHVMTYQENILLDEFDRNVAEHDDLSEFMTSHFEDEYIVPLAQNLMLVPQLEGLIVSFYIVEGLTRDVGTKHITETHPSTVDEDSSDNEVHDE